MRDYKGRALLDLEKDGKFYVALLQAPNPGYPQVEGSAPVVVERVHQAIFERDKKALPEELVLKLYQIVCAREKGISQAEQKRLEDDYRKTLENLKDFKRVYRIVEPAANAFRLLRDEIFDTMKYDVSNLKRENVALQAAMIWFERNSGKFATEHPDEIGKYVAVTAEGVVEWGSDLSEVLKLLDERNLRDYHVGILGDPLVGTPTDPLNLTDEEYVEFYKKSQEEEIQRMASIVRPRY